MYPHHSLIFVTYLNLNIGRCAYYIIYISFELQLLFLLGTYCCSNLNVYNNVDPIACTI